MSERPSVGQAQAQSLKQQQRENHAVPNEKPQNVLHDLAHQKSPVLIQVLERNTGPTNYRT